MQHYKHMLSAGAETLRPLHVVLNAFSVHTCIHNIQKEKRTALQC